MQLIHLLRIHSLWMVATIAIIHDVQSKEETKETCKPIPIEDIQEAGFLSYDIYEFRNFGKLKPKLKEGQKVRKASKYTIKKIYRKNLSDTQKQKRSVMDIFSMKIKGNPLRVVVATKDASKVSPATTIICFMGTRSMQQLLNEFWDGVDHRAQVVLKDKKGNNKTVKVLNYFWEALNSINETLSNITLDSNMKYIVTGHSLGGALASVFALTNHDVLFANPNSSLITFGQPRVGDMAYADLHDELIPAFKKPRFVYDDDIVPHIPYIPDSTMIRKLAKLPRVGPVRLPKDYDKKVKYQHTWREIWIQKPYPLPWPFLYFKWHVCPNRDGPKCSNDRHPAKRGFFDHDGERYIKAIANLKGNTLELDKFMKDQCPKH